MMKTVTFQMPTKKQVITTNADVDKLFDAFKRDNKISSIATISRKDDVLTLECTPTRKNGKRFLTTVTVSH